MLRLFILFLLFVSPLYADNYSQKACFKNTCIKVEVVEGPIQLEQGLMFRESMKEDEGMLFILPEEKFTKFWMRNMRFALDIIWMDKEKVVFQISENVPPCQGPCPDIIPSQKTKYVLEVNSGFSKRHQLKIGEKVEF